MANQTTVQKFNFAAYVTEHGAKASALLDVEAAMLIATNWHECLSIEAIKALIAKGKNDLSTAIEIEAAFTALHVEALKLNNLFKVDADSVRALIAIDNQTASYKATVKAVATRAKGKGIRSKLASDGIALKNYSQSEHSHQYHVANMIDRPEGMTVKDFADYAHISGYGISLKQIVKFFVKQGFAIVFKDGAYRVI